MGEVMNADCTPQSTTVPGSSELPPGAARPKAKLAVLANCLTPYRVHLHNCLHDGLDEVELHTLVTHGRGDFDFQRFEDVRFSVADFSDDGDSVSHNLLRSPQLTVREALKAKRIVSYLREHRIDAVIGLIPSYYSYYAVYKACRRLGIDYFIRSDANIHNERGLSGIKQTLKRWWYRRWLPGAAGVMPMGELGRQFFQKYWPRQDGFYTVPYWPNLDAYKRRDERAVEEFRDRFQLDPSRRLLLYCGRLVPVKRVDLLIDAFLKVADKRPDWDLLIMGAGPLEEEIRAKIPQRLVGRVRWAGFLEAEHLIAGYQASNALVLPSDYEPWALVVPEALAAGLPVVASDVVGAAHEMVTPGRNGEIFRAGDISGLVESLESVTDSQRYPEYQSYACESVDAWREQADPVREVRRALVDRKLLS